MFGLVFFFMKILRAPRPSHKTLAVPQLIASAIYNANVLCIRGILSFYCVQYHARST